MSKCNRIAKIVSVFSYIVVLSLGQSWSNGISNDELAVTDNIIDATSILSHVDKLLGPGDGLVYDLQITNFDKQQFDLIVRMKDQDTVLARFINPVKLTRNSYLFRGGSIWSFVPGSKKSYRYPSEYQFIPGLENEDILRRGFSDNYEVDKISAGQSHVQLELHATDTKLKYPKVILTLNSKTRSPQTAEYFTMSSDTDAERVIHYENYRKVLNLDRPLTIRILDQNARENVLKFSSLRWIETPTAWFTPTYLGKLD